LRVEQLIRAGYVDEGGSASSTGGRPARLLSFRRDAGCVLAVDLGVTSMDVAVTDLAGQVLAEDSHPIQIADGPEIVLREVRERAGALLRPLGLSDSDIRAVGIGVPGPVEFATGRP